MENVVFGALGGSFHKDIHILQTHVDLHLPMFFRTTKSDFALQSFKVVDNSYTAAVMARENFTTKGLPGLQDQFSVGKKPV